MNTFDESIKFVIFVIFVHLVFLVILAGFRSFKVVLDIFRSFYLELVPHFSKYRINWQFIRETPIIKVYCSLFTFLKNSFMLLLE